MKKITLFILKKDENFFFIKNDNKLSLFSDEVTADDNGWLYQNEIEDNNNNESTPYGQAAINFYKKYKTLPIIDNFLGTYKKENNLFYIYAAHLDDEINELSPVHLDNLEKQEYTKEQDILEYLSDLHLLLSIDKDELEEFKLIKKFMTLGTVNNSKEKLIQNMNDRLSLFINNAEYCDIVEVEHGVFEQPLLSNGLKYSEINYLVEKIFNKWIKKFNLNENSRLLLSSSINNKYKFNEDSINDEINKRLNNLLLGEKIIQSIERGCHQTELEQFIENINLINEQTKRNNSFYNFDNEELNLRISRGHFTLTNPLPVEEFTNDISGIWGLLTSTVNNANMIEESINKPQPPISPNGNVNNEAVMKDSQKQHFEHGTSPDEENLSIETSTGDEVIDNELIYNEDINSSIPNFDE